MQDENDYEVIAPSNQGGNSLVELVTKADIDTQISTAKHYPRSIKQFVADATEMVTLNEDIAESCNYGLPRAGKVIEGPSARFAEIILSAWGNCRAGARVVHEDSRFVTAQGVCHDLQTNTVITMEVKRRVTDKKGKTFADDMIGVTGNAAASIALRNAILRKVPKAFWEPIYQKSRDTALGKSKPMANRRADALAVMQKFGVTPDQIFAFFEIKGEQDLTLDHLTQLSAARTTIKAGDVTAEEFFAPKKVADDSKGNNAVKEKLAEKSGKKKPTKEELAAEAGADPQTGEIIATQTSMTTGKTVETLREEKTVPDPEQRETESVKLDKPVFSTAQIAVKGRKDDNTQPDFDAWKMEFMKRCNSAPSLPEISTLFKHNTGILNQIKSRKPEVFTECETAYNDNCDRLKDAPQ